jgi:hypothetical protein
MLKDDTSPLVRQGVCQALVALFRDGSDHVLSKLADIMEFMLAKTQDPVEDVAREACEFWVVFCEHDQEEERRQRQVLPNMLRAFIPRLVPVLLACMAYSKADREMLEAENKLDLDTVPDKLEDLRPRHFGGRGMGAEADGGGDGEDEDDDDDESGGGEVEQWNLRKCSASTLDTLAGEGNARRGTPSLRTHALVDASIRGSVRKVGWLIYAFSFAHCRILRPGGGAAGPPAAGVRSAGAGGRVGAGGVHTGVGGGVVVRDGHDRAPAAPLPIPVTAA